MKQQRKIHRIYIESDFPNDSYKCTDLLAHRLLNVLRIRNKDEVIIFNHNKKQFLCNLEIDKNSIVFLKINHEIISKSYSQKNISLSVAIVSMNIMDLIIQKAVELGVNNFYPVYSKRSQYTDVSKKIDHWNKIIIHSSEQCGRYELMKMNTPISIEEYIALNGTDPKYLLHQNGESFTSKELSDKNISFFVGPEGGFEDDELELFSKNKWKIKKISGNILRTETACISIITLVNNYESFPRNNI